MANTMKKFVAIIMAAVLGMSMGLQAIAATTTETETKTTVEGGITTTVTTTTETTTEDGYTKVVVTVKTEKEGVDENGVSVKSEETRTDTIIEENETTSEQWKVEGEETKWEKDPEQTEDDSNEADQPKVEVDLVPGDKTVGFGGEVVTGSNTETDENGITTTETTSTADRVVEAETSEIVTGSTAVSSDMHSNIDIGLDYSMSSNNLEKDLARWDYHVAVDEDGNFVKHFTGTSALMNSLNNGEYGFYWFGAKPLSSSRYFDGVTNENGELMLVPRYERTEEEMTDWLKSSPYYRYDAAKGLWVPTQTSASKPNIAENGDNWQFAFSGYAGISSYGMLVDHDGEITWNQRYYDSDGDGDEELAWEPINNGRVVDKEGNVFYVYCIDADTGTLTGDKYVIDNIQDVDYFTGTEEEQQQKKDQVRAIALNGFWGNTVEGGVGNLDTIKADLIKFLEETDNFTFDYIDPSNYMGGEGALEDRTFTVEDREEMIKLVELLDEGGALAVTQSALWEYGNRGENDPVLVYDRVGASGNPEVNYALALYRAYLLSDELREQTTEESTTVLDSDSFIAEDSLKLTVGDKVPELDVNNDEDDTNDVYSNDLSFSLVIVPGEKDDLVITLVDNNGNVIRKARIAGDPSEDDESFGGEFTNVDGVYTFIGVPMAEGSDIKFDLKLEGIQYLEEGVYVYKSVNEDGEADFGHRQTLVGVAEGEREVDVESSFTLNFTVDEESHIVTRKTWFGEGDLSEEDPEDPEDPEDTYEPTVINDDPTPLDNNPPAEKLDVPSDTETILDEDVPLAEVPGLGDESSNWLMIAVFAAIGFVALNLSEKKRAED